MNSFFYCRSVYNYVVEGRGFGHIFFVNIGIRLYEHFHSTILYHTNSQLSKIIKEREGEVEDVQGKKKKR